MASNKRPADTGTISAPKKVREEQAEPSTVEIDTNGDLFVFIGSDETSDDESTYGSQQEPEVEIEFHKQRLVRVNLALVKTVSPVFRAMLGSDFKEGQSVRDRSNPIKLPEDNPEATVSMFRLIHHQSQHILRRESDWLFKLFVVCDKYGCASTFAGYFQLHLIHATNRKLADTIKYTVIAARVGTKDLFDKFSGPLFTASGALLSRHITSDVTSMLPPSLLDFLEAHRKLSRHQNIMTANIFIKKITLGISPCEGVIGCIGKWTYCLTEQVYRDSDRDVPLFDLGKSLSCEVNGAKTWNLQDFECTDNKCWKCGIESTIDRAIEAVITTSNKWRSKDRFCRYCFAAYKTCLEGSCEGHD